MDSEIKKAFQISGYLLRSFANGLEGIARQIESLTQPRADQEPEAETHSGTEPPRKSHSKEAQPTPEPERQQTARPKTKRSTKTEIIMDVIADIALLLESYLYASRIRTTDMAATTAAVDHTL